MFRFLILGSGSGGNALLVESATTRILVDCGFTATEAARRLKAGGAADADSITAMVLTHCHGDHAGGAPVFSTRHEVPIFTTPGTQRWYSNKKRHTLDTFAPGETFAVGDIEIASVGLIHDAPDTVALKFTHKGLSMAICTDLGEPTKAVETALQGCDVLLMEANHDVEMLANGPYPAKLKKRILSRYGHISNEQSRDLLAKLIPTGTRQVILCHLSETNNTPALAMGAMDGLRNKHPHVVWCIADQDKAGTFFEISPLAGRPTLVPAPAFRQMELL